MAFHRQSYSYQRSPPRLPALRPSRATTATVESQPRSNEGSELAAQFEADHQAALHVNIPESALPLTTISLTGTPSGNSDSLRSNNSAKPGSPWEPMGGVCYLPTPLTNVSGFATAKVSTPISMSASDSAISTTPTRSPRKPNWRGHSHRVQALPVMDEPLLMPAVSGQSAQPSPRSVRVVTATPRKKASAPKTADLHNSRGSDRPPRFGHTSRASSDSDRSFSSYHPKHGRRSRPSSPSTPRRTSASSQPSPEVDLDVDSVQFPSHPVRCRTNEGTAVSPGALPKLERFDIAEPVVLDVGGDVGVGPVLHIPPVYPPVFHISYSPPVPEPLSTPLGEDSEFRGGIVSVPGAPKLPLSSSREPEPVVIYDTPDSHSPPAPVPLPKSSSFPHSLSFESRFESGNLARAVQVGPTEYHLWIRPDHNAENSHTQWYYFAVQNARVGVRYTFRIVNLVKTDSAYSRGMRPLMYSKHVANQDGIGWSRVGDNITYSSNASRAVGIETSTYDPGVSGPLNGHSLSFTITFPANNDVCYLAHCYPYTYSDLQNYLKWLQDDPARRKYVRRKLLCMTLSGMSCPLLTISDFSQPVSEIRRRKIIVLTARVHPGETNASWMIKGVIDSLTSNSRDAYILRKNFIFKIVPMLNPDGVVHGQGRCSLAGVDLNRQWRNPLNTEVPTVYATKNLIRRVHLEREVVLYTDLHGHSRKSNIFMYGCELKKSSKKVVGSSAANTNIHKRKTSKGSANSSQGTGTVDRNTATGRAFDRRQPSEKLFPNMLASVTPDFSYQDCSFTINKKKKSTARVVMRKEFDILNSFTLEASFAGPSIGINRGNHFTTLSLEGMGRAFCRALALYFCPQPMLTYARDSGSAHLLALIHECNRLVIQDRHPNMEAGSGKGKKKKYKRASRSAGSRG